MPTLYVKNIPADLYAALRKRARERRSSIAAETVALLREHVPTAAQLRQREQAYKQLLELQRATSPAGNRAPSTVALARESRRELERRGN